MHMGIDEAGHDGAVGGVDHAGIDGGAGRNDFADRAMLDDDVGKLAL